MRDQHTVLELSALFHPMLDRVVFFENSDTKIQYLGSSLETDNQGTIFCPPRLITDACMMLVSMATPVSTDSLICVSLTLKT